MLKPSAYAQPPQRLLVRVVTFVVTALSWLVWALFYLNFQNNNNNMKY